jgi:AbrB family looped-hinge helix DNA binding protein
MWHSSFVSHRRVKAHIGERGRLVVPAAVRRRMRLAQGDLVVIEETEDSLVVRKAADLALGLRGYLRDVEPGRDLAAELIAERREEAERESPAAKGSRGRNARRR